MLAHINIPIHTGIYLIFGCLYNFRYSILAMHWNILDISIFI